MEKLVLFFKQNKNIFFIFLIGTLIGYLVFLFQNQLELLISLILILSYLGILLFLVRRYFPGERKFLSPLIILGLTFRYFFALAVHFSYFPKGFYPDENAYFQGGLIIKKMWLEGQFFDIFKYVNIGLSENYGYHIFNALHYLLYENPLLPKITNVFLGVLLALLVYNLARKLFSRKIARISAAITLFVPNLIYWSGFNLKDILVTFLILSIINFAYSPKKRISFKRVLLMFLAIFFLFTVRFYVAIILLFFLLLYFFIQASLTKKQRVKIILISIIILTLFYITNPIFKYHIHQIATQGITPLLRESQVSLEKTRARGYFLGGFETINPQNFFISLTHFLVTPSPYRFQFSLSGILHLGTLVWYILIPYFILGTWYLFRRRPKNTSLILGFIWALIIVYSFLPSLAGVRQRAQFMPLAILVAVVGFYAPNRYKKGVICLTWLVIIFGITFFEVFY